MAYQNQYYYYCYPQPQNYYYCFEPQFPPQLYPHTIPKRPDSDPCSRTLCKARTEMENSMFENLAYCRDFVRDAMSITGRSSRFGEDYTGFRQDFAETYESSNKFGNSMTFPDVTKMINPLDETDCWKNLNEDLDREIAPESHMRERDPPPPPSACWVKFPTPRQSTADSSASSNLGHCNSRCEFIWKHPKMNPNVPRPQSYPSTNPPDDGSFVSSR